MSEAYNRQWENSLVMASLQFRRLLKSRKSIISLSNTGSIPRTQPKELLESLMSDAGKGMLEPISEGKGRITETRRKHYVL